MKIFVSVLVFTAASAFSVPALQDVESEWFKFKTTYGKVYKSELEELERKEIFTANYKLITEHNAKYEAGLESFSVKINEFADITAAEIKLMTGYKKSKSHKNFTKFQSNPLADVPDTFNWRPKGAVTPVKNQGTCGSCWAFSVTGTLEGQYFLKTGKLVDISAQNLVDCSTTNHGCAGGNMVRAMDYIKQNDGIDSEASYPYTGEDGRCQYDVANNVSSLSGSVLIEVGNEDQLKEAVATVGPISVAIYAGSLFPLYNAGIYAPSDCFTDADYLNHAVLVVGYGSEDGQDYWLVKNSWGFNFGIEGYIKMIRNANNHCGIASEASYPLMY